MDIETDDLTQSTIIPKKPPPLLKLFETIEFENEQKFLEWLECEKKHLDWQKRVKHIRPGTQDESRKPRGSRPVYEWIQRFRCPYWGSPRPYCHKENSRVTHTPSRKVGCKAILTAHKKFNEDKVWMEYDTYHQGHELNSVDDRQRLKNSSSKRKRLTKAVKEGSSVIFSQDSQGSAPKENFDLAEVNEIFDMIKSSHNIPPEASRMIKRLKSDLNLLRESLKEHINDLDHENKDNR